MNWKKVSLTFLAFALLAPCLPVYAQSPPRSPVFIEDNYDLAAAIAQVPFNVSLPAEPVITSEAICTTEAEITASLAVNGRRTIIAPGSYSFGSVVNVSGNDKHIVFQPGASFSRGFYFSNASRIKLEGAVFVEPSGGFGLTIFNSQDMIFERIVLSSTDYGFYADTFNERVLFLSSSITQVFANSAGDINDFIVANSQFVSTTPEGTANGWAMRWWGDNNNRNVFIDSRFAAFQNTCIRFEGNQVNGYFARNQIEGTSSWRTGPSPATVNGLWFLNNHMYATSGGGWPVGVFIPDASVPVNVIATGNRAYGESTSGSNVGFPSGQPTWTLSDNALVYTAWPSTPPVWEMR